ncbi:MAG: hypothetical protein WCC52_08715 [Nitrosotalea sp.]
MTQPRVKLKSTDDNSKYGYPKRVIEIRTGKGDFQTPTRAITNHEYYQKVASATDITFDGKTSIFFDRFTLKKLKAFLTEDKPFENLSKRLKVQTERSQHSYLNLALLKPSSTKDDKKNSAVELLQSSKRIREKYIRMIIQLQRALSLDPVVVPIMPLPEDDTKEMMREIKGYLDSQNVSVIFFFDLNRKLPALLNYAIKDLQLPIIGLNYKRYTSAVQSYEAIREYSNDDVAFVMANTTRADALNENISTMHYLPFLSNDIFSSFVPPPVMTEEPQTYQDALSGIKLFSKKQLILEKMLEKQIDINQIMSEVERPNDHKIREMLTNYNKGTTSDKTLAITRLRAFSKVHEAKSSLDEFVSLRKHIEERSTKDYVDSTDKKFLKKTLDKIK